MKPRPEPLLQTETTDLKQTMAVLSIDAPKNKVPRKKLSASTVAVQPAMGLVVREFAWLIQATESAPTTGLLSKR